MTIRLFFGVIVLAFSLSVGLAQSKPSIEGVWRITEQTINDRTLQGEKLGAGFHIYTKGYFAVVRETGESPRPGAGEISTATTAAQLIAAWGPFVAQMGTYKVSGDRLIGTILVAKNPENMKGDSGMQKFTIQGDTLTLEPAEIKPGARVIRLKLIRVE